MNDEDPPRDDATGRERPLEERPPFEGADADLSSLIEEAVFDATEDPVPPIDPEVVLELAKIANPRTSWQKNIGILVLTVIVFVSLLAWETPVVTTLIICGVLFVHEMGHLVGMKLLGYRDVQMFFIPFFGAAVSGQNVHAPGWKQALVTFLGPLTGLLVGMAAFVAWLETGHAAFYQTALACAYLNVFNLLPLYPLDGGKFLQGILFSRSRYLESFFRVVMGALTILAAVWLEAWLLAVVGVFVVLKTPANHKLTTTAFALRAREDFPDRVDPNEADADLIATTQEEITRTFGDKVPPIMEAGRIWEVWEKVNARAPGVAATIGFILMYVVTLLAVPAAPIAYAMYAAKGRVVERTRTDGSPQRVYDYRMGRLRLGEVELDRNNLYHGAGTSFSLFGGIESTEAWLHGFPHGEWKRYDAQKSVVVVIAFDRGRFVERTDHPPGGKVRRRVLEDLPPYYREYLADIFARGPFGPDNPFRMSSLLLSDVPFRRREDPR